MNNTIVIDYLRIGGYNEKQITNIINSDKDNELAKLISEYESIIIRNGFTRIDALNTFKNIQIMKSLDNTKKKLLKK